MSVKNKIFKIIPGYTPPAKIVKWIYGQLLFLKSALFKEDPKASDKLIAEFILEQARVGNVFLNVNFDGNELPPGFENAPYIIYKADSERTKKFGYHPVEIMWMLEARGYFLSVLDKSGNVVERKSKEYEGNIIATKEKL